ncbi:uncharacterized protein [Watersipora subatra]|uniref:uncharacterized protein n=1 Tax=Watersipora subatra TaxID=2589382 RepID=UPI00355AE3D1
MLGHHVCSDCLKLSDLPLKDYLELEFGHVRYRLLLVISLTQQIFSFKEWVADGAAFTSHTLMDWWRLVFKLIDMDECMSSPAIISWMEDVSCKDTERMSKSEIELGTYLRLTCLRILEEADPLYIPRVCPEVKRFVRRWVDDSYKDSSTQTGSNVSSFIEPSFHSEAKCTAKNDKELINILQSDDVVSDKENTEQELQNQEVQSNIFKKHPHLSAIIDKAFTYDDPRSEQNLIDISCFHHCPGKGVNQHSIGELLHVADLISISRSEPSYPRDFKEVAGNQQGRGIKTFSGDNSPSSPNGSSIEVLPFEPIEMVRVNFVASSSVNQSPNAIPAKQVSNVLLADKLTEVSHAEKPPPTSTASQMPNTPHVNQPPTVTPMPNAEHTKKLPAVTPATPMADASHTKQPSAITPANHMSTAPHATRFPVVQHANQMSTTVHFNQLIGTSPNGKLEALNVGRVPTKPKDLRSNYMPPVKKSANESLITNQLPAERSTRNRPVTQLSNRSPKIMPSKQRTANKRLADRKHRHRQRKAAKKLISVGDSRLEVSSTPTSSAVFTPPTPSKRSSCSPSVLRVSTTPTHRRLRSVGEHKPFGRGFKWKFEDDRKLYSTIRRYRHRRLSPDFNEICKEFNGRSADSIRNRWSAIHKRKSYLSSLIRCPS